MYIATPPGCCKAGVIYGFGYCDDYPQRPSPQELEKKLLNELSSIEDYGSYSVLTAYLNESQHAVVGPILRKFGFDEVCVGEGGTGMTIHTYTLSGDDLTTYLSAVDEENHQEDGDDSSKVLI